MRTNLITRLKEEWNNLDPIDPLRGLIADAIDALASTESRQPRPFQTVEENGEMQMKLTRALHGSDLLELTDEDIALLRNGNSLQASGLIIKKFIPDVVMYYKHDITQGTLQITYNPEWADLRVTYSGPTGKMLNAEVL